MIKKFVPFLVILTLILTSAGVFAINTDETISVVAAFTAVASPEPAPGVTGGEWAVIGLARSECGSEEYFNKYLKNVTAEIKKKNGVLSDRKYTEYSKTVLALDALGVSPENIGGYNLVSPLFDFEKVVSQGINGAIWALIALESNDFSVDTSAIKERYVEHILKNRTEDGGWTMMTGGEAEADITAMALVALKNFRDKSEVESAVNEALATLSDMQKENGGFASMGAENAESCAQVLTALSELGVSPNDSRFVKNGKGVKDALMTFLLKNGSFEHIKGAGGNLIATEQALYALCSAKRAKEGKSGLFDFRDVPLKESVSGSNANSDIKKKNIIYSGKTFADTEGTKYGKEISELASRGIVSGMTETLYCPEEGLTRAQFATITVNALGLPLKEFDGFTDVKNTDWFYGYVAAAKICGIVNGITDEVFMPQSAITIEQAAVMTARAARICGIESGAFSANDILSDYYDYREVSSWAEKDLAFCIEYDIMNIEGDYILPKKDISRGEMAVMIYNMLRRAELI